MFRDETITHRHVFLLIHAEAQFWKMRLPKMNKAIADGVYYSYYPYVTRIPNFDDIKEFDSDGFPKWDLDQ